MAARTGRKLVPARNKKKVWSKEDEMYLEDSWGVKSIKTIAKNLGRSENAVIVRAKTRMRSLSGSRRLHHAATDSCRTLWSQKHQLRKKETDRSLRLTSKD